MSSVLNPHSVGEEPDTLRPQTMDDFIGQAEVKKHLRVMLNAAKKRGQPIDHLLFAGPPGLGKTTLAQIIAHEMGANLRIVAAPALTRPGDLAAELTVLADGDVLFIDEIHALPKTLEEVLYSAMEDFCLDISVGEEGTAARTVRVPLPHFTLVGATTQSGKIAAPLLGRFGWNSRLDHYPSEELALIVERSARILNVTIDKDATHIIGSRSRGTPRIANRLLRRAIDYAESEHDGTLNETTALKAMEFFGVDDLGLDKVDRMILDALCNKFSGRPVGVSTVATSIGEAPETVEHVHEPFLLAAGLLVRTARGRVPTSKAWTHLGLEPPGELPLPTE